MKKVVIQDFTQCVEFKKLAELTQNIVFEQNRKWEEVLSLYIQPKRKWMPKFLYKYLLGLLVCQGKDHGMNFNNEDILTYNDLVSMTIHHWNRMILFAKDQNRNAEPNMQIMLEEIGETYTDKYCPMCKYFYTNVSEDKECRNCPLFVTYKINCNHPRSAYRIIRNAENWEEWARFALKLVEDLKGCHVLTHQNRPIRELL